MINQAIILAGGLGTRLRSAVPDLPKCMAPVAGKPFLEHVVDYFQQQGINEFIFAVGYKSEIIIDFVRSRYPQLATDFSIERELLGTGGAIRLAAAKARYKDVLVSNGDTIFKINVQQLSDFHQSASADCTIVLKPMTNFERYGVVEISTGNKINSFKEKQFYETGLISGGIYALNVESFLKEELPEKFSFENDYLEALYKQRNMFGIVQDRYFIDIGIPADYEQAQTDFK
jgi:D-glycero-alpha-D-manno-heptose 1-phosphate guanylyltransferase